MHQLIRDLIPHAPQMGLFVSPKIPPHRLRNAIDDYAHGVAPDDVLALYDATLIGNGKDGAIFTAERVVFQNNAMEPVHDVRYADVVDVVRRRRLIGGRRVVVKVNRGRATFDLAMDFSGRPQAADYVARVLQEAMLRGDASAGGAVGDAASARGQTDLDRVRANLVGLRADGALSEADLNAMLRAVGARPFDPDTES